MDMYSLFGKRWLFRGVKLTGSLLGVSRADDIEVRDHTHGGDSLNGLMGWAVLADTDGVVGPDVRNWELSKGSDTDGGAHVISEDKESSTGRLVETEVRETVHDGTHGVLPDTVEEVAASIGLALGGTEVTNTYTEQNC